MRVSAGAIDERVWVKIELDKQSEMVVGLGLRPGLRQDKAWNQARVRGRRFRHLGHRRVAELFGIMDMASMESWHSRTLPGLCILQLELGYGSC